MFDLDTWAEINDTMRRNKLRTLMTAAGVFWGMFMLLIMLGFGEGLSRGVERSMGDFATNSVFIWGQRTSMPHKGMQPGRRVRYRNADVEAIAARVAGIEHLAPRNQLGGYRDANNVSRFGKTGNYQVMGDYPAFQQIQPMALVEGRTINRLDIDRRRKVAIIGQQVMDELYEPEEPVLGTSIGIRGVWFQIVGIVNSGRAGDEGDRENGTISIPFTTFQRAFNYGDSVHWFAITAQPHVQASVVEERVKAVLKERHRIHPDDSQAIGSFNAQAEFLKVQNLFGGIEAFVWFVGSMTLLAGIIGVSNIMLIAVRERTREIGLRRAIGATPASVVSMILQEAVALTAIAGGAGVVSAVAALEIVRAAVGESNEVLGSPQVGAGVAAAATLVLVLSGLVAGLLPARHAAAIHPVEALRGE